MPHKKTPQRNSTQPSLERRSRRRAGSVTLMHVAKLAGVSPITASRALNTPGKVSPEALERVKAAVKRTGYVPNMLAGGLASSRSRLVAAIVPTIAGSVFLDMVQSLTETLSEAGYQLMLGQSGYDGSREDSLLDAIIGRRPDGIVITGVMHSPHARQRLIASGIPIVETWDLTEDPIDMLVGFSHEQTGAAVARYVHERGYEHPAVVSADDPRARRRAKAFVQTARRLARGTSIPVHWVSAPTNLKQGRAGLSQLLAHHPETDCVFCSSDLLALGVLTEAHARRIPVPKKLGVIGFGDLAFASELHPPLTTVRIDGSFIGRQAANSIIQRAQGEAVPDRIVDIGYSVISRGSA
jgi:LacI family transcriptional regulator, gluconate utilization system Gnt-I transcriptional repressor